jgi:nucleoside-diphosphate-sugar epimerase
MRVLVTGGSGYLGSAIGRALTEHGHQPVPFSRQPLPSHAHLPAIAGDLRWRGDVERAVGQGDAVCHAGALVSLWRRRFRDFDDVNVTGTRHLLEACRAHRIGRMVYTASFLALPPAGHSSPLAADDWRDAEKRLPYGTWQMVDGKTPAILTSAIFHPTSGRSCSAACQ